MDAMQATVCVWEKRGTTSRRSDFLSVRRRVYMQAGDIVNTKNGTWARPELIRRVQPDPNGDIVFFRVGFARVNALSVVGKRIGS